MNPWGETEDFYLPLVMAASRVLDVGCGTGMLLHAARRAGHPGRLCGLDPDPDMLALARRRDDIEWLLADAASASFDGEFDLAVMASHAFQVFVADDQLRDSLAAIAAALAPGGRFAFETRHPQARAWERWPGSFQVANPDGDGAMVGYEVHEVNGDVVRFTEALSGPWWARPQAELGALRFLEPDALTGFLRGAGLVVEEQFGGWDRGPVTGASEEIITIARRA